MKKLIVACALMGAFVACKTENKSVGDASSPNTPKAECSAEKSGCWASEKPAACSGAAKSCEGEAKPQN